MTIALPMQMGAILKLRSLLVILMFGLVSKYGLCSTVILNHSNTAFAGDVIYLQGSGFGSVPFVQYSYIDSTWKSASIVSSANSVAMVQIPWDEVRLPDLLELRVSADGSTWSQPVYVNKAQAFSMDSDQVSAGGNFRIFGRNLKFKGAPTVRLVDSTNGNSLTAIVDTTRSSSYLLYVVAPLNVLPAHHYQVYVNNGSLRGEALAEQQLVGRSSGTDYWGLGTSWAADLNYFGNVYNVSSDPRLSSHTMGTGRTDDTAVLQSAINAASAAGGGVVFLPGGSYNLRYANGCGLTLAKRVAVIGAGQAVTTINYGFGVPPGSGSGYGACFSDQSGFADLTMNNANESGMWPESGLSVRASEVFLQRVNWNIGTSQWLSLISIYRLAIENCKFSQGIDSAFHFNGILNVTGCTWCQINGNTIHFAVGGMLFDSVRNSVFENNVVTRDISIAPDPRSVTHFLEANFASDMIILGNTFTSVGTSGPTNNDGEVINTEGGGPERFDEFRGSVTASTSLTLSDDNQDFSQSSNYSPALRASIAMVAIVSGDGTGQTRKVIAVSSDCKKLTVEYPWDVQPKSGDHYATFDWSASKWIIAQNVLRNNFKGIEFWDASVNNILVDSNTLVDSSGIMLSPNQAPPGSFNVTWGVDINNNTVIDAAGLRPAYVALVPREDQQTTSFGVAVLGVQVRGNNVVAHVPNVLVNRMDYDDYKARVEGFICTWQWQTDWSSYDLPSTIPPLLGSVFQANTATNSDTAILLNSGATQNVFTDLSLQNVSNVVQDDVIGGALGGSDGTVISNVLSHATLQNGQLNSVVAYRSPVNGNTIVFSGANTPNMLSATQTIGIGISTMPEVLNLLSKQLSGDVDAAVRIELEPNAPASTNGLLMIRSTLLQSSPFVSIGRDMTGTIIVRYRTKIGVSPQTMAIPASSEWVRLVKTGSTFHAFHSSDGTSWVNAGVLSSVFPSKLFYVGLTGGCELTNQAGARFTSFHVQSAASY